ncbi:MAG: 3 beta-hydroxysteroid dehydrogenase/Delta 5--_4-isomerase [Alphaproteobacteria bacterium MarineAlpha6_Bin6]|nr:MAG: 3 beta-hydroxysteroid dehydrogenase/Delta 5-->4-isomerase [Alphaproteobacteria bacterium MarineAlpha6_Bin6]PPR32875.1 MAG: 3 beta-hydroxysteroid dehydrogenase/Delta 5-->4-isomerase [Alphaproteobacteria bacterium MarineAlpha6_Bin5]|tara:strand:+ start:3083 stop:4090 length:1008 start_codon:yes stop_codon:yes gene_type:complete
MKTLITGATGFVGAAVLRELLKKGHKVKALVRQSSILDNLKNLDVETVQGDLIDRDSLKLALKDCKYLFHVAADYRLWVPKSEEIYLNNVKGTENLMEEALSSGVEKVVYTSSVAVLGKPINGDIANEKTPVNISQMIGHYKKSKFLAEEKVKEFYKTRRLPVVIVNPAAPVGPRDIKPTPTGKMILDAAMKKIPAYLDTGLNVVHVDDVAKGHLQAFHKGKLGERYILGGDNLTFKQILEMISSMCGHKPPKIQLPKKPLYPIGYLFEIFARLFNIKNPMITVDMIRMAEKRMFFSSEKAKKELNYKCKPAKFALKDAINWFINNGYCRNVSLV